jgi:hypothetical protein
MEEVKNLVKTGLKAEQLPSKEREKYEVILLLDVIEHLPDPKSFIKELLLSFPNVSKVLVTVPAGPKIWSNYDEFYGHYRRYNLTMLTQLEESLGACSIVKNYFFHLPYLPARLMSSFQVRRNVRMVAPAGIHLFLNKVIAKLMWCDFLVFPKRMIGTSALACFKLNK